MYRDQQHWRTRATRSCRGERVQMNGGRGWSFAWRAISLPLACWFLARKRPPPAQCNHWPRVGREISATFASTRLFFHFLVFWGCDLYTKETKEKQRSKTRAPLVHPALLFIHHGGRPTSVERSARQSIYIYQSSANGGVDFNLEGLRTTLDAQASGIGDNQDTSSESRKKLAEATKSTLRHLV